MNDSTVLDEDGRTLIDDDGREKVAGEDISECCCGGYREVFNCSDDSLMGLVDAASVDPTKAYRTEDDQCVRIGSLTTSEEEDPELLDPSGWTQFESCTSCFGETEENCSGCGRFPDTLNVAENLWDGTCYLGFGAGVEVPTAPEPDGSTINRYVGHSICKWQKNGEGYGARPSDGVIYGQTYVVIIECVGIDYADTGLPIWRLYAACGPSDPRYSTVDGSVNHYTWRGHYIGATPMGTYTRDFDPLDPRVGGIAAGPATATVS